MKLTIEQINKKINSIEGYYNNFNMMSYEYDLKDKMYLGRLYKLKLKLLKQQASRRDNMKNNCQDCDGLGYFTDVISTGLSDPNDPYHEPHTERCDTCMIFDSDIEADNFLNQQASEQKG